MGQPATVGKESYYNEKDLQAIQMLAQISATMNDPSTIGGFYGASALLGFGLSELGAYEGGVTALELGGGSSQVTPTAGQVASISRTGAQSGRKAVEKALRSFEKRLAQHIGDMQKYKEAGGPTSYTEKEIANFKGLAQAAKDWLSKNP